MINRVSNVHSSRTTDESLHYFVLPFQLILYSRIETARQTSRTIRFFAKIYKNFEIRRPVPRVKKIWRNSKRRHASLSLSFSFSLSLSLSLPLSLSLSLSLLVDPPMECLLYCLSLYICKHGLDPDQTRMVFRIECFVNLKMCAYGRKYAKRYM